MGAGLPRLRGVTGKTAREGGAGGLGGYMLGLRGGARSTGQNGKLQREGELRGRGCGGRAGSPSCAAGAGRRQPLRPGLTKRKQPSSSGCSPSRRGQPKGAGVGRTGTSGGARQGRGTSCLGPRPGPNPKCFEAADLVGSPVPSGLRADPPARPTHPERLRSPQQTAGFCSSAGMKPLGHPSLGLVRPRSWPRLSLVGPQRQSPSVAPPLLQSALLVGPECP